MEVISDKPREAISVKTLKVCRLGGLILPLLVPAQALGFDIEARLDTAGKNASQVRLALSQVPEAERSGMRFLIDHMPEQDLRSLSADFLLEHVEYAYKAWRQSPWRDQVDESLFLNCVLPYASVNERRDAWRQDFYTRFTPLVRDVEFPGEAAAKLNNELFKELGVRYSRKRLKPDQSPYETIDSGLASCTGLSILLVDACRAVGIPARFVGTPLWSDGSGNHSWVEVWDNGWRFTGAAEPTGMALNRGWFVGRARRAERDNPRYAIYATSFRRTPIHFPMVWDRGNKSVSAVNVTDRYTSEESGTPEGHAVVRFRLVTGPAGERIAAPVKVMDDQGEQRFAGKTRDERFDGNDHLSTTLPVGGQFRAVFDFRRESITRAFDVVEDEQLITVTATSLGPIVAQLEAELARPIAKRRPIEELPFAATPLTAAQAAAAAKLLWADHQQKIQATRCDEMQAKEITLGEHSMRFAYSVYGEKPRGGRSLFISMHGGGGAPSEVNTRQWKNQQRLYMPEEGVYLAPRAPTDTWNLWHRPHVDALFARLIENLIVFEDVNADRVYLMGYSAGGDGAYQLAPRMADRWAAAAMMAGHPGDASPLNLRNIGFTLFMGGRDAAYDRNKRAAEWKKKLADLQAADPAGYRHLVTIYPNKGHWMDRQDASSVPWMAAVTRDPFPAKVVWRQDDVTHSRFYWLSVGDRPAKKGDTVVATLDGQSIDLDSKGCDEVTLLLNDEMLDLDRPVRVTSAGQVVFQGTVDRTLATIGRTLAERGDPRGVFSATVSVSLTPAVAPD
ncbi:MAG: transglutaminase domain-containing protein [Planctomycetota bacterium]